METASEEEQRFREFAHGSTARLLRTAFLLTLDRHLAEDLVQEALARVYSHWPRLYREVNLHAYTYRVLVNTNLNWHRRRRVVELLGSVLPERVERADAAEQTAQRSALLAALAELPPRQRATVVLRYWEDLAEEEVARIMGCSVGNVKSQASRALAKLRTDPRLDGLAPTTMAS